MRRLARAPQRSTHDLSAHRFRRQSLALPTLGLLAALLTACPPQTGAPSFSTLPQIGMSQSQVIKLDLDDYVSDPDNTDAELTLSTVGQDATKVNASIDAGSHILTLTAASYFEGRFGMDIVATDPAGNKATTQLELNVHANRTCSTVFSYDSQLYGAVTSLAAAGNFNSWSSSATPMRDPDGDGIFTSEPLVLAPGYYQYKLVKNGSTWMQDPANPYRAWEGGFENSELQVPDCNQPLLKLQSLVVDPVAGTLRADVGYVDGATAMGPSPASLRVTLNGADISTGFSDYLRTFEIRLSGLKPGKHTLRVYATSSDARAADMLFVPNWIDAQSFDWSASTLYFAFTDRFSNGNTANDGPISGVATTANYQGGDFAGLKAKIDAGYLSAQGITSLWITPQIDNTNNAEYGDDGRLYTGYHGYWPTTNVSPESRLGSDQELRDLITSAHSKGIRVLFDLVANQVHNQHPYYNLYKNSGWFNAYSLCKDNDGWNTNPIACWFAPYLPDLNYQNADALHTLLGDARRLIMDYDIDGYRVDAVKHMETAYIRGLVADVERLVEHGRTDAGDQFYLVGETFTGEWTASCQNNSACSQWLIKQYIGPGLLDGQFDFPMYWQVLKTFARGESDATALNSILTQSELYYGADAVMSYFLGNHDVARFISHANGDIADQWGNGAKEQGWTNPPAAPSSDVPYKKLRTAFTFLAGLPGVPLVYYGDDIGLPGAGDPDNRRMMKFGSSLSANESATLTHVQTLNTLRQSNAALQSGSRTTLLGTDPAILVYARKAGTKTAIVATNSSGASKTVTVSTSSIGLSSGTLSDALGGSAITVSNGSFSLTLGSHSSAVYVN